MKKIIIILLDPKRTELAYYRKLCLEICSESGFEAVIKGYTDSDSLLFDFGESSFVSVVDLVILDPEGGGETIAATLRGLGYRGVMLYLTNETNPPLFLQAFDAGAFNYLIKGKENLPRLRTVLQSALRQAVHISRRYIIVQKGHEIRRLPLAEIKYFEAIGGSVSVCFKNDCFEFVSTLLKLESRLGSCGFVRVSKSFLVSLAFVSELSYEHITMADGKKLSVGRSYYPSVKQALARFVATHPDESSYTLLQATDGALVQRL
ncbi:MAG: response regulator transcription factor [Clostridium sp.]|jgi:FixJ family two-component response regulator|nr:response regulator transcription factor [Clostridium sp.]